MAAVLIRAGRQGELISSRSPLLRRRAAGVHYGFGSAATAWAVVKRAQQSDGIRRIGVLMGYPETDAEAQVYFAAFRNSLRGLGWLKGRNNNIKTDTRWATPADAISLPRFAKELVALQPDLILSNTTPTTAALLQQTHSLRILFAMIADPVGSGFVASFARPGGNVTGFVVTEGTLGVSAWTYSRRSRRTLSGWPCSLTQQQHHMPKFG